MARDDSGRDEVRQVDQASPDETTSGLDAEEEAAAEASQRPGPRGRIGGLPRGERAGQDVVHGTEEDRSRQD